MPLFRRKRDNDDGSTMLDRLKERVERSEAAGKKIPEPVRKIIRAGIDIAFPRAGAIIDAIDSLKSDPDVDPLVKQDLTEVLQNMLEQSKVLSDRVRNDNEYVITRLVRPVLTLIVSISAIFAWWLQGLQVSWFKMDADTFKLMWFEFVLINVFWFGSRIISKDLKLGGRK